MTIDNVSLGELIDPDWGNEVADEINSLIDSTATYTPTLTGMVIGTGGSATNSATYRFVGGKDSGVGGRGLMSIIGFITFGTSGATFPTAPTFSLPSGFNLISNNTRLICGSVYLVDNDTAISERIGSMFVASTTTVTPKIGGFTTAAPAGLTTTTPFTWAVSDSMIWTLNFAVSRA